MHREMRERTERGEGSNRTRSGNPDFWARGKCAREVGNRHIQRREMGIGKKWETLDFQGQARKKTGDSLLCTDPLTPLPSPHPIVSSEGSHLDTVLTSTRTLSKRGSRPVCASGTDFLSHRVARRYRKLRRVDTIGLPPARTAIIRLGGVSLDTRGDTGIPIWRSNALNRSPFYHLVFALCST